MSDVAATARTIRTRLGRLRARIRAIFAVVGVSRWLVALVALVLAFFAADYFLNLPLGVRRFVRLGLFHKPMSMHALLWLPALGTCILLALALTRSRRGAAPLFWFLTGGIVGLLIWVGTRVFFPMRVRLRDDDLALTVESRFASLKDRLAAALDFSQELRDPGRGESPDMMRSVVADADREVRTLRFSQAASAKRALQWGAAAAGALILGIGTAAAASDAFGLFARRSILLEDVDWPRATILLAVDIAKNSEAKGGDITKSGTVTPHDASVPFRVSVGRSITLYARAQGTVPDEVFLTDLVEGQQPLPRRMFRVAQSEDLFAFEFRDVRRPFAFAIQGGDDNDERPTYRVEITVPPKVLAVRSHVTYPEYLAREPKVVPDGSVRIPAGSKVAVEFDVDLPISRARVTLGDKITPLEALDEKRDGGNRRFRFHFDAEESTTYRINLLTPDGRANDPTRSAYRITVLADEAPRVTWTWPRGVMEVSPTGHVALLVQADDDHGVASLALEMRLSDDDIRMVPLTEYDADLPVDANAPLSPSAVDGTFPRKRVRAFVPIEIGKIRTSDGKPLPEQGRVAFRWLAKDTRGQNRESDWGSVDIFPRPVLERGLSTRRAAVRAAFDAVYRDQEARLEDVKSLLTESAGRDMTDSERDQLKSIRFRQGRIAQDADRGTQDLIAIFNAFVYDRLGAAIPNSRILAMLDRHHRATYGALPEVDDSKSSDSSGEWQAAEWLGDPVFPYAVYDKIVAAWENKTIYDVNMLDRMLSALRDAVAVSARSAPGVHRAASIAADGNRASVEALRDAQQAHLDLLKRLRTAIAGWQTLSDLTEALRGVVYDQREILEALEDKKKKKND